MKNSFALSLFNRFGLFYGMIGSDLILHFEDDSICDFLSIKPVLRTVPLTVFFNEVIGLEDEILKVINGEKKEYSIRRINRSSEFDIFFNLYFLSHSYKDFPAIVVVRNVTNEMLFYHSLQQSRNEIQLLQHELLDRNRDLDRINRELEEKVEIRTKQYHESSDLAKRLFIQTVNSLTYALELRDPYTTGHQQRVAILASAIAANIGLDEDTVEGIRIAGLLHDIGKIYVPSEFLTKPGILPEEEYNVIKTHPLRGFEILKEIEFPWPVAACVIQHHEKINGSGYPFGLEGEHIMLEAKILCVADVVEAMGTNRPYRISPGINEALQEIGMYRGIKYDSSVVDACIDLFKNKNFRWRE
jgi:putative nucleotidyltransferase with HDIG domain